MREINHDIFVEQLFRLVSFLVRHIMCACMCAYIRTRWSGQAGGRTETHALLDKALLMHVRSDFFLSHSRRHTLVLLFYINK